MTNLPHSLVGETVQSCVVDATSIALNFGARKLVIHNRWKLRSADESVVGETSLVGMVVTDLAFSDTSLHIEFGPVALDVDFSASAWAGPEAAVFYVDGAPVVAWT